MKGQTTHRTIVVGLVWNDRGQLLLCRMKKDRGVFPGQWGFPGGGIAPSERMEDALHRELREELGIEIENIRPAFFKDGTFDKLLPGGAVQPVYLIFLVFHCRALSNQIRLNEEFAEYRWVSQEDIEFMELNDVTVDTLSRMGPWQDAR